MFKKPKNNPGTAAMSSRTAKGGFTAVETVVGAVLMTVLITSMLHLLRQGNYLIELARDHTRVTQILQSEIEDMRTLSWADMPEGDSFEIVTPEGNFVSSFSDEYYCYRYTWNTKTDSGGEVVQKEVYVLAVWYDSHNRSHVTYYRTRFTKDGLNDYYYRAV